ncbi:glutathione S-transferase [Rhodoferax sp. OV413]|uniref:glutathione S-transferase family protein n=1 Tax=Rhodoferax sp. OV413 TaxID=1855285 RepID=UPI0026006CCD|nr:glutathione S-transferase [Rhodoferax sp. OV413]
MHIWGRISSLNVRKVVWAAQECGAPFERSDAGLAFGVVNTPEYRALNPNALVPVLRDGDLVLWESNTIVRYLCSRYGANLPQPLYPADLAARFDAERWMDWQQTTLHRAGSAAFMQWFRTPAAQRDQAVIDQSTAAMAPLLRLLDAHLAVRPFMGGAHFGMADIPVACDIHRWFGLPQPRASYPHLDRWFATVLDRPATRGALDVPLS